MSKLITFAYQRAIYNRLTSTMEKPYTFEYNNSRSVKSLGPKKERFILFFRRNPHMISEFKHYTKNHIDVDSILDEEIYYSNYVDSVFNGFLDAKPYHLYELFEIFDSSHMAKRRLNEIYKSQYGGYQSEFSSRVFSCPSMSPKTYEKVHNVIKIYKEMYPINKES